MDQVAPNCPDCKRTLWHEGQTWSRTSYTQQSLVHRWKCLECGTVVVAAIPVTIYKAPDSASEESK